MPKRCLGRCRAEATKSWSSKCSYVSSCTIIHEPIFLTDILRDVVGLNPPLAHPDGWRTRRSLRTAGGLNEKWRTASLHSGGCNLLLKRLSPTVSQVSAAAFAATTSASATRVFQSPSYPMPPLQSVVSCPWHSGETSFGLRRRVNLTSSPSCRITTLRCSAS